MDGAGGTHFAQIFSNSHFSMINRVQNFFQKIKKKFFTVFMCVPEDAGTLCPPALKLPHTNRVTDSYITHFSQILAINGFWLADTLYTAILLVEDLIIIVQFIMILCVSHFCPFQYQFCKLFGPKRTPSFVSLMLSTDNSLTFYLAQIPRHIK